MHSKDTLIDMLWHINNLKLQNIYLTCKIVVVDQTHWWHLTSQCPFSTN